MESWLVVWRSERGEEQRREFPAFLEAWIFNEEQLKGRGEVILLTDRPLSRTQPARSEAAAARQTEGGRRWVRKK
ncbi:MAG TPA: hypothetical protein VK464_20610 [Symbiobacteriaceae bacterium]|jgi:hypothetical protein|nr:hypothetical protein [Symbiobacteriaceae bacterium]